MPIKSVSIFMKKAFILFIGLFLLNHTSQAANKWQGQLAPDFKLQDQHEEWKSLADYKDSWLILYFYPKDDTPGCTTEAKNFRDGYQSLKELNAEVVGISLDDLEDHKSFSKEYQLPFSILSDKDKKVSKAYKVLGGFGPIKYSKRQTFIIDPLGNIVYHFEKVDADKHFKNVHLKLQRLQKALSL